MKADLEGTMTGCVEALRTSIADYEEALARRRKETGLALPERPWLAYVRLNGDFQALIDGHNDELRERSADDRDLEVTREIVARRSQMYGTLATLCRHAMSHGT